MHKGPTENIEDYIDRFQNGFALANPGSDIHNGFTLEQFITSLGQGLARHAQDWMFRDPNDLTPVVYKSATTRPFDSWSSLCSAVRQFFVHRNPRDAHDEAVNMLADYKAKQQVKG